MAGSFISALFVLFKKNKTKKTHHEFLQLINYSKLPPAFLFILLETEYLSIFSFRGISLETVMTQQKSSIQ